LLSGERTALNYLQRMSGIATYTHEMVQALQQAGAKATLVDTRKTTPGMRYFEKMAVRIGGGTNHRFGLSDAVMLKDNHIAAAGGIRQAVAAAKRRSPFIYRIEVECETIAQVKEAVAAHADVIMLDNMTHEQMKEAIKIIDGRALTECSGNITLENAPQMADLGIDYISSGALTHSAGILDLSNKNLTMLE
jgi:nicotinate-nucleotide pyrophosphorylase (carboxylating)